MNKQFDQDPKRIKLYSATALEVLISFPVEWLLEQSNWIQKKSPSVG